MSDTVVVIGAGPAGMMAAGRAAQRGKNVKLIERNRDVGKKLLITGKGRCNITNSADIEDIISNVPGNGVFLYSSLYTFSNADIINFLESRGLRTKVERGGRVFPLTDKAGDVVDILRGYCLENGVKIITSCRVREIKIKNNAVAGVITDTQEIECQKVIIATGGKSYRATGSTGDGYKFAKMCGHTVISPKPSLVPLVSNDSFIKDLQGLSLKNVQVSFFTPKGFKLYEDFGELMFTHFGVSGPVVLSGSRFIGVNDLKSAYMLIDLKPALNIQKVDKRIQRDFEKYSRKQFKNALSDLLPTKLIPVITELSGIDKEKEVNQITKAERMRLAELLKGFKINIQGTRPINEAIVTAGGIKTEEIDPGSMESKIIKGLYFAGEVIDVDGFTGGYNLTIAFSTGYVAGSNC